MYWNPGWPYAALAVIQHEYDLDHLNVWLRFSQAMDILAKPGNATWIVKVDGVEKSVTDSAWQDEVTMLLTVPDVEVLPDRVLVKYEGPFYALRTTYHKQWEPWGPILSQDITT